ncbi:MAG: cytochrome c3 family protein, partial [Planctomycetes bacterium]|nr:cytochrome c3 family protein [Planctomycetota bacterium]
MRERTLLPFLFLALLGVACGRGGSGHRPWGATDGGVDKGEPAIAAAPGHAGSETCQGCHAEIFAEWERTFHNLSVRRTDRTGATGEGVVADADGNGRDDFRDGLDLATDADFAAFGGNAPRLLFNGGATFPHRVRIGAVTYEVWRTLGGNGVWHQRYLTRIGETVFYLPIEYVEATRDWIPYESGVFYDGATPRFASLAAAAAGLDPAASFDLGCAGCHATGLEVSFDAGSGQYVTGYEEITIGCEACHGPGAAHAAGLGDPGLILNPADLLDGTANGVLAADLVCGRCHVKGEGGIPAGGAHPAGYPWRTGGSTFPPGGTDFDAYYTVSSDPADWWRYKDNPSGFAPTPADKTDDTRLAARSAELTWPDLELGVHGPAKPWSPYCFSCHDPHSRAARHQIRTEIRRDGNVFTGVTAENNKLCLVCHQGHGDFDRLTAADIEGITDAGAPVSVVDAVLDHMK